MWLKIFSYALIVLWGALAIFAFRNVKKTFRKYKEIREVDDNKCNWKGSKRTDFNRWDEKAIVMGCFFRFPFKFVAMYLAFVGFAFTVLTQNFLRKVHKNLDKFLMRKVGFFAIGFVYDITEISHIENTSTPIMISNHVNWFDIVYHSVRMFPISFVSKADILKVPVVGRVATKIQCAFLERESQKSRTQALEQIQSKIDAYNKDSYLFNPLIIFPEGTTSNGQSILRFKAGAFRKKSKITIVSFNYSCKGFDMGMDEITPIQHFIISLCLDSKLEVRFKEMEPTDQESVEDYMERCQRKLSKMTGYPIENSGFTEKNKLKQARFGKKDA